MLSVSKLLSGTTGASVAEAIRYSRQERPVIVWNITRSCPLHCVHCYNNSELKKYPGELTTVEGKRLIDDLAAFKAPVLIFSGGDPLLREDLFELMSYSKARGVRPVLSTSGIGIDKDVARKIKASGALYVGISLDGGPAVNDRLRGMEGAFNKAIDGIRNCKDAGLVVGIRFTMSKKTIGELPAIFNIIENEGVQRGYFAHLVYSGRGERFSREDLDHAETRAAVDFIFKKAFEYSQKGMKMDIVTGSSDVDGVYLYLKLMETDPAKAQEVYKLLLGRGGNSSGVMLGNIDNLGDVHADQFWTRRSFGNVKERPFGEIWTDTSDPVLRVLKNRKGVITGRCSRCRYFDICGGNYRVRSEFMTGDPWAEDPACYLTDKELGIV